MENKDEDPKKKMIRLSVSVPDGSSTTSASPRFTHDGDIDDVMNNNNNNNENNNNNNTTTTTTNNSNDNPAISPPPYSPPHPLAALAAAESPEQLTYAQEVLKLFDADYGLIVVQGFRRMLGTSTADEVIFLAAFEQCFLTTHLFYLFTFYYLLFLNYYRYYDCHTFEYILYSMSC